MAENIQDLHKTKHARLAYVVNKNKYVTHITDEQNRTSGPDQYFNNADQAYAYIVKELERLMYLDESKSFAKAQDTNYKNASSDDFNEEEKKKHWYWG